MNDTTTIATVNHYPSAIQKEMVEELSGYQWERCVTLNPRPQKYGGWRYESDYAGQIAANILTFVERVNELLPEPCEYWFGLCQAKRRENDGNTWSPDGYHSPVHVHGQIKSVSGLTAAKIVSRLQTFGFGKVVHWDGNPKWLEYVISQTRRGEILTNITELQV